MRRQEWAIGTLADVAARAQDVGIALPAALVVGEVALAAERLRWVDLRPLAGRRIVITRAAEQAAGLSRLLEAEGAEVVTLAAISIEPAADAAPLDRAIQRIERYQWVIFTSANGVRAFVERLHGAALDWRALKGVRLGAIGPATAEALRASQGRGLILCLLNTWPRRLQRALAWWPVSGFCCRAPILPARLWRWTCAAWALRWKRLPPIAR